MQPADTEAKVKSLRLREAAGDFLDFGLSLGDIHYELKRLFIFEVDGPSVGGQKHSGSQPAKTYVPVDESVIANK